MATSQPLPAYANFSIEAAALVLMLCDLHFAHIPMRFKPFAINLSFHSSLRSLAVRLENCSPENLQCILNIVGLFSSIKSLESAILDSTNAQPLPCPLPGTSSGRP